MRNIYKWTALLLCAALLTACPLALAEEAAQNGEGGARLTVTGAASVLLSPDYATISLGVTTHATTLTQAQAENAELMTAVLAALRQENIAQEDMQTSNFSISPVYVGDWYAPGEGAATENGFRVENTLTVTVRDLNRISPVLDAAVQAGVNQTYGLSFESSQRSKAYERALQDAVADARSKAELLALAAGKSLGDLEALTEQSAGYRLSYASAAKMDSGTGAPILSGTLSVDATVEVTYRLR